MRTVWDNLCKVFNMVLESIVITELLAYANINFKILKHMYIIYLYILLSPQCSQIQI